MFFLAIEGATGNAIIKFCFGEQVAISEVGETVTDTDVEIPTFCNGAVIVESYTNIGTSAVIETVLGVHTAIAQNGD